MLDMITKNLEDMMYKDYHIHAGIDRKVVTKKQEKDGESRTYIIIRCYTLNGRYKGQYKCGYINNDTGEYVTDNDDVVDAVNSVWIGE